MTPRDRLIDRRGERDRDTKGHIDRRRGEKETGDREKEEMKRSEQQGWEGCKMKKRGDEKKDRDMHWRILKRIRGEGNNRR